MPALFLECLPCAWDEASRRALLTGRTVEAAMVRSPAEVGVCFALSGGFLADMEGDGDDVDGMAPLVWMPGGTGRLAFVTPFCWTTTGLLGAMVPWLGSLLVSRRWYRWIRACECGPGRGHGCRAAAMTGRLGGIEKMRG